MHTDAFKARKKKCTNNLIKSEVKTIKKRQLKSVYILSK